MKQRNLNRSDELRTKAETLLAKIPADEKSKNYSDIIEVIHELHVHQIELEIQNEELQDAYRLLEKSKTDYMRLYHDAPVGYVVLDQLGVIRKINKTFSVMLDIDPASINGRPFADFLMSEDRAIFRARLKAFYKNPIKKQIDVRLNRGGHPFHVSLRAVINSDEHPSITGPSKEMLVTVIDINEQYEYQTALEKNRKELEIILSSISDGFMSLDNTLVVQYFNNAAEKILKIERQEVLHRQLFDVFPEAKGSYFEAQYRKALQTREVTTFETFFTEQPYRDWYEVAVYPFKDGLSIFFRVITERKVAEKALKESEERFRGYIENSPYGILVSNEQGDILRANPAICEISGYSRETLLGMTFDEIFTPGFPNLGADVHHRPLHATKEIRYTAKDRSVGWASVSTVKLRPGQVLHFVEEVSERKRIEKELLESQRALTLFNRIATLFLTSPGDELFNEILDLLLVTFECTFGYVGYINGDGDLVCPTLTGDIWEQCNIPDKDYVFNKEDWGGLWGRSLSEKCTFIANEPLNTPAGHLSLFNALVVPIIHHSTVIGQFVLANKEQGFTKMDRKLLENAANQTAPILQILLDDIEQQKLKRQLDRLSYQLGKIESLNRMAGAIAHNYNNLLTIIMGNIEMAMERLPNKHSDIRKYLADAMQASENGAEIGQRLLTYLGHAVQEQHHVELSEILQNVVERVHNNKQTGITVNVENPPISPVINVDPKLVEKLLENIIENALEAVDDDAGTVSVKVDTVSGNDISQENTFPVQWQPEDILYGCISITDDGSGMDDDSLVKIFDPFYSEKFTGRGMGLAIVMGIIQLSNGGITVESTKGGGSTFRVYLPVAE